MTDPTPRELKIELDALERRIDQRFCALNKALELQAEKDQQHFTSLNNNQERLSGERSHFQDKAMSDLRWKAYDDWKMRVENQMSEHSGSSAGMYKFWSILIVVIVTLISAWEHFK